MSNVIEDEPCPQCGALYRVRWIDGDTESDTWQCSACHYEWLILVRPLTTTVVVACIRHHDANNATADPA